MRRICMLRHVPRHPRKVTTSRLRDLLGEEAPEFAVSLRTVQRDLSQLASYLPLVSDDQTPPGWSWGEDAPRLDIPVMDAMSAMTFSMVERFLSRHLPPTAVEDLRPYFDQAREILRRDNGNNYRRWLGKVAAASRSFALPPPKVSRRVMETVYGSLFRGRRFRVRYQKPRETTPREYVVNPLGIVLMDQVIYLVATLWDYQDVKRLALHRMKEAECLPEPARTPPGFSLRGYVGSGELGILHSAERLRLAVLFRRETAFHLEESPLSPDQTIAPHDGDRVRLEATVPDTDQLRWWLQAFGDKVEVLEPPALRAEFAALARSLASLYQP